MAQEGSTQPKVAINAPGIPATWMPTKVAELMAMGPGVISAMAMMSANWVMVSQGWRSTTWCWIRGMAA